MSDGYDFWIPAPAAKSGGGSISAIIRGLPVGGSKFFPGADNNKISNLYQTLRTKKQVSFKVSVRKVTEDGVAGVRVWRLDAE